MQKKKLINILKLVILYTYFIKTLLELKNCFSLLNLIIIIIAVIIITNKLKINN